MTEPWLDQALMDSAYRSVLYISGTVCVLLSDHPRQEGNVRFKTIPLKTLSYIMDKWSMFWNYFQLWFLYKSDLCISSFVNSVFNSYHSFILINLFYCCISCSHLTLFRRKIVISFSYSSNTRINCVIFLTDFFPCFSPVIRSGELG